jgi:hypothetical protein
MFTMNTNGYASLRLFVLRLAARLRNFRNHAEKRVRLFRRVRPAMLSKALICFFNQFSLQATNELRFRPF